MGRGDYNHFLWKGEFDVLKPSRLTRCSISRTRWFPMWWTNMSVPTGGTSYSLLPSGLAMDPIHSGLRRHKCDRHEHDGLHRNRCYRHRSAGCLSATRSPSRRRILVSGVNNLVFQNPANLNQTLISLNFDSVSNVTRISTVEPRHEFSAFAPPAGNVTSAYQLQARPLGGATNAAAPGGHWPGRRSKLFRQRRRFVCLSMEQPRTGRHSRSRIVQ